MKISVFGDYVCQTPMLTTLGENVKDLLKVSDFNIINFEAPLRINGSKPIHKSGPNICQPGESAVWLEDNGFNIVALANNHLLDFGIDSALSTKEIFKDAWTLGLGNHQEAYDYLILKKNDIKVGLISLTHREFSCVEDYGYGCAWMSSPKVTQEILKAKNEVDYLIILNHGGLEYYDQPLPQYRALYKHWIDLGADAVIASHPHVPQGWEEYQGRPIFYSLGNFLFEKPDGIYPPFWNNSLTVALELSSAAIKYQVTPLIFDPHKHIVEIDRSNEIELHIAEINEVLKSHKRYRDSIHKKMIDLSDNYDYMLNVGKYSNIGFNLSYLKSIARYLLGKKRDSIHHLNLYRCETHRWVMEYLLQNNLL